MKKKVVAKKSDSSVEIFPRIEVMGCGMSKKQVAALAAAIRSKIIEKCG